MEPAIPGLQVRAIGSFTDGPVLIIRAPRSWASPHMVSFGGRTRFYLRVAEQKVLLDREGIRQQFLLSETLATRLERFRDSRIGRVLSGDTPVPLRDGVRVVDAPRAGRLPGVRPPSTF